MTDWNDWSTAPSDGRVFEASDGMSQAYVCVLREQEDVEETSSWFGLRKKRTVINPEGTYLYLAMPVTGGYVRLNLRSDWKPNQWRELRQ